MTICGLYSRLGSRKLGILVVKEMKQCRRICHFERIREWVRMGAQVFERSHSLITESQGGPRRSHSLITESQGGPRRSHSLITESQGGPRRSHSLITEPQGGPRRSHYSM